jgi:hypothetical protein
MVGLYDVRADDLRIFERPITAPITALTLVSDTRMLVVSPVESRFFDLRNGQFEEVTDILPNGRFVRSCRPFDYHVITTCTGTLYFTKYRRRTNELVIQRVKTVPTEYGGARPALASWDDALYGVFAESPDEFRLYAMARPDLDLWGQWKDGLVHTKHDSELLDLGLAHDSNDFLVFGLSKNLLQVVSIPS